MDIFSGVTSKENGGPAFFALLRDEDVELEFHGALGNMVCSVLNGECSGAFTEELRKAEEDYRNAERKEEKTRLFFRMDRLQSIAKKFRSLNSEKLHRLVDLVFLRDDDGCPVSQRLFYYGYFMGEMRLSAQVTLLGSFAEEPGGPEGADGEKLREMFLSACEAYREHGFREEAEYNYRLHSVEDMIRCCLFEMARHGVRLRKCRNCGRYFVPENRSDTFYCDGPSPQDPDRSCRQYNSEHLWYERLKENGTLKLCRNIASAKQMRAKRNPASAEYAEDLKRFRQESKQWKKDFLAGQKSEAEFAAWLQSNRGKRKH